MRGINAFNKINAKFFIFLKFFLEVLQVDALVADRGLHRIEHLLLLFVLFHQLLELLSKLAELNRVVLLPLTVEL